MGKLTSAAAHFMAKARWAKIPKSERSQYTPRNGGPPRIYPKCKRYRAHRFNRQGRCSCGYVKNK